MVPCLIPTWIKVEIILHSEEAIISLYTLWFVEHIRFLQFFRLYVKQCVSYTSFCSDHHDVIANNRIYLMISGFRCQVDENCAVLGYFTACSGKVPVHAA